MEYIKEVSFVNNLENISLLTVGQVVQPKMQFLLLKFRSLTNGNRIYSSLSLLLIGDNSLV